MFKYTSQAPTYVDTIHSVKTVPQLQQHIHVYTTSNASMYSTVSILTCERQAVIMHDKLRVMHDTPHTTMPTQKLDTCDGVDAATCARLTTSNERRAHTVDVHFAME